MNQKMTKGNPMAKIQKFKTFLENNIAQDYVVNKPKLEKDTLEPKAKGEKDFANMHNVSKVDYTPVPGQNFIFDGSIQKEEVEYIEDDEESDLSEGKVFDALQDIVKTKGAKKVKFANGKSVTVDMQTANAMIQLHKKLNDKNKEKMLNAIEKSPDALIKLMDVAFGGK